jgi:uncharacterized protein YjiS (DUF1127 family)
MLMNSQSTSGTTDDLSLALSAPQTLASRMSYRGWRRVIDRWIERGRQRRALMWLDDQSLADIGITRPEAAREAAKPFWR